MASDDFRFGVYRLNIVDSEQGDLFSARIRTDGEILKVLTEVTDARFDTKQETRIAHYLWSARELATIQVDENRAGWVLTLARSTLRQEGKTVTAEGLTGAVSLASPPLASTAQLVFIPHRHLVAVESNALTQTAPAWRKIFHDMIRRAASSVKFSSTLVLEPVPPRERILSTFRSFKLVTRVRVFIRLPNPELSEEAKRLFDELKTSGVREYLQDMRNPNGLSKAKDALAHASLSLAQGGYKEGTVVIAGLTATGERKTVAIDSKAVQGRLSGLKDFVRGAAATAKTKETKGVLDSVLKEIDKIVELPATKDAVPDEVKK